MSTTDAHQPSFHVPIVSTPILPRYAARPSSFWEDAVMSSSGILRSLGTFRPSSLNPQPKVKNAITAFKLEKEISQSRLVQNIIRERVQKKLNSPYSV